MKYQKLTNTAKTPTKDHQTDAGFDFYADCNAVVKANGGRAKIPTGIALEIPPGYGGFAWPRSKLADKYGLDLLAGVVDAPYRGEVMINIINYGDTDFEIRQGDKLAQVVFQPVALFELEEASRLSESDRGKKGINDSELRLR